MYKIQGGTNIKPLVTKILLRGIRLSIGNKNLINENHLIITKPAQKPVQKPAQKPDGRLRKKMNGGGSSEFFENI